MSSSDDANVSRGNNSLTHHVRRRARRTALLGTVTALAAGTLVTAVPASAVSGTPITDPVYAFAAKVTFGDVRACSGALVAPQWVLTSRSCLVDGTNPVATGQPAKKTTVTVGRLDLAGTAGHVRTVNRVVPHPDRNLALLRLASLVPGVTPVTLGTTAPTQGETLQAVGFGRTATEWMPYRLHGTAVTVDSVATGGLTVTSADPAAPTTCRGDRGGPAVRVVAGRPELVAVHDTSWQGGCLGETQTRRDATEVRTDDLATWIRQQTPSNCNAAGGTAGLGDQATVVLEGDVTGDCRDDMLAQLANGTLRAYPSSGNLSGSAPLYPGPSPDVGSSWTTADKPRVVTGDFTGDGRSDIIAQTPAGDLIAWASTGDVSANHRLFAGASAWVGGGWTSSAIARIIPGDYDGDGRTDLIAQYTAGDLRLWLSTGDLSSNYKLFAGATAIVGTGWTTSAVPRILPGDFNGDGRTDLIAQMADGDLRAWPSNGDASADHKLFAGGYRLVGGGWTATAIPRVVPGDLDGDGITDLVAQWSDGTLRAYRSTGDLSADVKLFPKPHPTVGGGWSKADRPRIIGADATGDGRMDIIGQTPDGILYGFASTGDLSDDFKLYAGDKGSVASTFTISNVPRLF